MDRLTPLCYVQASILYDHQERLLHVQLYIFPETVVVQFV